MLTQEKITFDVAPSKQDKIRVLLVEDDEDDYVLTRTLVSSRENANIRLDWIDNYEAALEAIQRNEFDVYLIDYRLGENTGIDLIQEAFRSGSKAPMILLTGQDDLSVDYSALELGAADYLVKGRIDAQVLGRSIRYALRQAETLAELAKKTRTNTGRCLSGRWTPSSLWTARWNSWTPTHRSSSCSATAEMT